MKKLSFVISLVAFQLCGIDIAYNQTPNFDWVNTIGGSSNDGEDGCAITVDTDGNVIVVGGWTEILGSGRFMQSAEIFDLAEFDETIEIRDASGETVNADETVATDEGPEQNPAANTTGDTDIAAAPDSDVEMSGKEQTLEASDAKKPVKGAAA